MKKKIALIFGITGQDGSYLAKYLISKNYLVHGVKRRSSIINTKRIDDIYEDINIAKKLFLHYGDVCDSQSVFNLIKKIKPNEIYNLAAQSHVAVSFQLPDYTFVANTLGCLRILESIKIINPKIRFYQAGSSEMFGSTSPPQNELSRFYPMSPYAISKLSAHWLTINYRESFNLYACNGILFNHESPVRGETFVTKKIIKGLCDVKKNKIKKFFLGNIYAKRDWGHASDYVKAMWLMLQQKKPDDFVIATGTQISVKEFINLAAKKLDMKISWKGKKLKEKAYYKDRVIIEIKSKYFRPSEVDSLKGSAKKARKLLKWSPTYTLSSLIDEMIEFELKNIDY